ncbi:ATP-binding cassette domain-containing protein [Rugosimonospora africana]|uniref:Daunorubicin resistance protein DrrA family ABC transporter ATP-binding protein n=1 Tax=Rugosimonospora africana TaxID=556532 RepID=A0A8J3QQR1_9ACTN|nr:ATP-binding cassette domain-containing protein [Rugosimonospora africana]GIH14809.1 daunorubicin resistance protein DrrA family ABC transporter ATP-binding protein [Rugosimonospora africana]
MRYAIEAEGLVKRFDETVALAGVDLAAAEGTVLGLLGRNGAGKTTAVRILATLARPDAGTARVGGHDVVRSPDKVRKLIGLTGQYASVDENLTGAQNLFMIGRLLGMSRPDAWARAAALLARFGLSGAAERGAKGYSGGMRRRLDLAASLVGDPRIIYLDEPTTGLDPHARVELWDVVRALADDGVTVLLTTQYMDEADQLADAIAVLDRGTVVASGTPDSLKAEVGGQRLEVRPARPEHREAVAGILAGLAGREPERRRDVLWVPVSDLSLPPEVFRRLDEAGIPVAELSVRHPSLDEVFLALTKTSGAPEDPAGQQEPAATMERTPA